MNNKGLSAVFVSVALVFTALAEAQSPTAPKPR